MALKFAVYLDEKDIEFWKKFSEKCSKALGQEITLKFFFYKNKDGLFSEKFDIYYLSPDIFIDLNLKDYIPVASSGDERRRFLLIKKRNKKFPILLKVVMVKNPFFMVPVVKYFRNITHIEFWYYNTCKEVLNYIYSEKFDIAVVCEEVFEKYENKNEFEVLETFEAPYRRILVTSPDYEEKIRDLTKFFKELTPISRREARSLIMFYTLISYCSAFKELHAIALAILNAPSMGIIIFREKILYANKFIHEITGYSGEELENMSILDLIDEEEEVKKEIDCVIKKRLSGEQIERLYLGLKARRKDGSFFYVLAFTKTILYQGNYAGLALVVDITRIKKIEKLYEVLKEINQSIITSLVEEELYQKICYILVKKLGLRFVWIGVPEREGFLKPIFRYGCEDGYLSIVKSVLKNFPESRMCVEVAFKEKKIIIINDIRSEPLMNLWKEEMLKRNFLSVAVVPVVKYGKVIALIVMYADEPRFFEEAKTLLEELQRDVNFALEKMEEFRNSMLIKTALENSNEWVLVSDVDGTILYANEAVFKISGYTREELVGKNVDIFYSDYHPDEFYQKVWETVLSGKVFSDVFVCKNKRGKPFYLDQKIIPVELPGGIKRFVSVAKDVTKERLLSREVEKLKFKDILTGLHNFNGFSLRIQDLLKVEKNFSLLAIIDIFRLTYLNQTYGLEFGNKVLKEVADRLKNSFRKEDIIARVGGDEFGIYVKGLKKKEDGIFIKKKLEMIFKEPIIIDGQELNIKINGGVAIFPDDGKDFKILYEHASVALSEAKREGVYVIKFFNPDMEKRAKSLIWVANLVEKALKEDLFVFYYQPYFYTDTLELAGFEALVRIKDKEGNIYPPSDFINYLERSPYLKEFEAWALKEVIDKIKKWGVPISLNISANSLKNEDFVRNYLEKCKYLSVPLTLELTERAIIENMEQVKNIFNELKSYKIEIRIAIDDFGTGYSALIYLKDIPADYLKIDMSFIKELDKGHKEKAIVKTIIYLAHSLGMKTIAEGVETREQLQILKDLKCDMVQGFLLAKPMPEEEVKKMYKF